MRKITISIPDDLYKLFKSFCEKNGYKMSSVIQVLIRDFIKK